MTKKEFLELLIRSFSLIPKDVKHYKTSGFDGAYEVGVGWRGRGKTIKGATIIDFCEPDGFEMAVYEILKQAKEFRLPPSYPH